MACIAKRRDRYVIDYYDNRGNVAGKLCERGPL